MTRKQILALCVALLLVGAVFAQESSGIRRTRDEVVA